MSLFSKTKFNDNRLAEEFDLIVLLNDNHRKNGLQKGALGTLISSYLGKRKPLFAQFKTPNGNLEEPLDLDDFRVLNEKNDYDLSIIVHYLLAQPSLLRSV
jgi:hypothetical protein